MSAGQSCYACGKVLKGRTDKKYCNDSCRNAYNNQLKSGVNNFVRNVNNALGKNRRVLESLLGSQEETARVSKQKLQLAGFNFKYNTHSYTTKAGKTYLYCYNYGYLELEKGWFLIVRQRDE